MKFALILLLFLGYQAHAVTVLPRNLNDSDRAKVAQILGFGSMMKLLSNPYPLGGYEGIEFGVSSEYIPLEDIAKLGSKSPDDGDLNYYTISVGKGLYRNVDVFLQFAPIPQSEKITNYGAQVRWGFYEADFFPFTLSSVFTLGGTSFSSLVNSNTYGIDLVGAVTMKDVALYFGAGRARAVTTFIGGTSGINADTDNHKTDLIESHAFFGVHVKVSQFFFALEVDRYVESSYSGKIGMRF